jgi:uncharacterized protein YjbJ (UPF0337 family)
VGSTDICYLTKWRKQMKLSTKDEINGNIHEGKGAVKETAGNLTNSADLKAKGKAEHKLGRVEKKAGQIEKVIDK